MNSELLTLYNNIKKDIIEMITEKEIDINALSFDLGIDTDTFVYKLSNLSDDFSFYLRTLSLVENWEG